MKKFKTQAQRVLDMMINSIYTHKEIFIRELVSNASDAIDKQYYRSLQDGGSGMDRSDFFIRIVPDEKARTLKFIDNGCGMTETELDENLGVIAKSGSDEFKKAEGASNDEIGSIIGQFGVGFYSAFMVADRVEVLSRAAGADGAFLWKSEGSEGYTITPAQKAERGTEITLWLKPDTDGENYDEFSDEYRLKTLVKKYSDYIKYPILMDCTHTVYGKDGEEDRTEIVTETLNSMVPLWKKAKNQITKEEYDGFYRDAFNDYTPPLKVIHTKAEGGSVAYNAILFIPARAPYDYYTKGYQKGLRLYTNGVLIMENCEDLLPDCLRFVRGLVDCDLTLNVSRETVQHNRQLKLIAQNLEKKILSELALMLKNDRDEYLKFFKEFGLQLKYGVYDNWGEYKEKLKDLLVYQSVKEDKFVTLAEYVEKLAEGQDSIYYATGKSAEAIKASPRVESALEKGYDVLCFTQDVDEFAVKMLEKYDEKEFRSVSGDASADEDKTATEENSSMFTAMKTVLGDAVKEVRASAAMKSYAACLTVEGEISIEMEKVLKTMPGAPEGVGATKILELNPQHPVFATLKNYYENDRDSFDKLTRVLHSQACLLEGIELKNPAEFARELCELLSKG